MDIRKTGVASAALLAMLSGAAAASPYNLSPGVTELTREVYGLHMLIFWICCAIGVVVFGAMIYSIFAHRKSVHPKPADFHESIKVEIAWTVVPFLILIGMAIPAAGTLIKMEDTSNSDLTIKITGYQWKWEYEYLDHDYSFFSTLAASSNAARQLGSGVDPSSVENYLLEVDNELVLPVGKKVRLLLTANDVIHAWWVPEVTGKKDAIPGYINKMWVNIEEPGVYRGQCAELCGRDHGFMPIVVRAVPADEFDAWLAEKSGKTTDVAAAPAVEVASAAPAPVEVASNVPSALSKDDLMEQGKQLYGMHCAACHQPSGEGMAAANFPALKGSPVVNGDVAGLLTQIINGKNAMPGFAYLKDTEIASITTYTRNAWGNSASTIQGADVAAQR
ncbi:MAG: cytochrome c oxidase subunit II [Oceanococcaceae bacterium]